MISTQKLDVQELEWGGAGAGGYGGGGESDEDGMAWSSSARATDVVWLQARVLIWGVLTVVVVLSNIISYTLTSITTQNKKQQ